MKNTFYFTDFFKNLFTKKNIPLIIYLAINLVLETLISFIFVYIINANFGDPTVGEWLCAIALGTAAWIIGIIVSLSPIGEWLMRKKNKCKEIEDEKIINRIEPLFDEVKVKAMAYSDTAKEVKLFINDDEEINAFAMGRKTVCINKGLLRLSDEEIKSVLAHEFGHIAHHDTDVSLVVNVSNTLIIWFYLMVLAIIRFSGKATRIFLFFAPGTLKEWLINRFFSIIFEWFATVATIAIVQVWNIIGNLLIKKTSRQAEFEADRFACEIGYTEGLYKFLSTYVKKKPKGFLNTVKAKIEAIGSTHPSEELRIESINAFTASRPVTTQKAISEKPAIYKAQITAENNIPVKPVMNTGFVADEVKAPVKATAPKKNVLSEPEVPEFVPNFELFDFISQ